MLKKLIYILPVLLFCLSASAQEQQEDSLVVLMSSKSAQLVDIEGASYRKVVGPARFLHNNTYLLCDTALWNVDSRFIDAWGNVSILQDETVLTSDKLTYLIDEDLAQFRGSLVQLHNNTLPGNKRLEDAERISFNCTISCGFVINAWFLEYSSIHLLEDQLREQYSPH